jgi:hypothetical protein
MDRQLAEVITEEAIFEIDNYFIHYIPSEENSNMDHFFK